MICGVNDQDRDDNTEGKNLIRRKTSSIAMQKNQAIVSFREDGQRNTSQRRQTIKSKEYDDYGESRTSTRLKEKASASSRPVNSSSFLSNNTPPIGSEELL